MKNSTRYAIAFLIVLSLVLTVTSAFAVETDPVEPPEDPEEYVHLNNILLGLSISSNGLASLSSCAYVSSGSSDTVYITMRLQRYSNGSWTTVKTWSGSGTRVCDVMGEWYVYHGYSYRNYTTVTVYTSSGSFVESVSVSNTKYY